MSLPFQRSGLAWQKKIHPKTPSTQLFFFNDSFHKVSLNSTQHDLQHFEQSFSFLFPVEGSGHHFETPPEVFSPFLEAKVFFSPPERVRPPFWNSSKVFSPFLEAIVLFIFFHHFWNSSEVFQSIPSGSMRGIVCSTSSRSCKALWRWISIQHGVSLMLCRG